MKTEPNLSCFVKRRNCSMVDGLLAFDCMGGCMPLEREVGPWVAIDSMFIDP